MKKSKKSLAELGKKENVKVLDVKEVKVVKGGFVIIEDLLDV